jgi:hypothetical protein
MTTVDVPEAGEEWFKRAELVPKLTTAQVRALAAVRDGLVTQRYCQNGNVFRQVSSMFNRFGFQRNPAGVCPDFVATPALWALRLSEQVATGSVEDNRSS